MDTFTMYGVIFFGGIILFMAINSIVEFYKNEKQPMIKIDAVLVIKSTIKHSRDFNSYQLTFETNSKERLVFNVNSGNFSIYAEGDKGTLTYQGSRFISFRRAED